MVEMSPDADVVRGLGETVLENRNAVRQQRCSGRRLVLLLGRDDGAAKVGEAFLNMAAAVFARDC
jgi:hypothetical protein